MLIEKSTQLIELSQKKINLQRYATNLQGFQTRQQQIEKAVAGTIPLIQSLRAFRRQGIANFDLTKKADELLAFIANVEAEFKADPEWIIKNKNFNERDFKLRREQLQKALENQLERAWQLYRSQKMPSTNNEILNLLDKVSAFKPTAERIRNLDSQIIQESKSIPQSIEDFERVDELIDRLKQCWDRLDADEVPEAVLRFLRVAATNEGATRRLLTPEVEDWLAKHRLIDCLRIRLT